MKILILIIKLGDFLNILRGWEGRRVLGLGLVLLLKLKGIKRSSLWIFFIVYRYCMKKEIEVLWGVFFLYCYVYKWVI